MDVKTPADLAHSHVLRPMRSFGISHLSGSLLVQYIHIEEAEDHVSDHPVAREPRKRISQSGAWRHTFQPGCAKAQY